MRASARATHCVLALRLRTLRSRCAPLPAGVKPSSSSTTKSSGSARSTPLAAGAPWACGGASAAARASSPGGVTLAFAEQDDRLRGNAFRAPEEPQPFGGRRLDVDALFPDPEQLRDLPAHRLTVG